MVMTTATVEALVAAKISGGGSGHIQQSTNNNDNNNFKFTTIKAYVPEGFSA